MDARLVVSKGNTNVQQIQLKETTVVGRLSECDLRILSQAVSRRHCEIFERGERLVVRDLGSTNGTAVNGALIEEQVLEPNDKLTIGPLEFTVLYQPPTEIDPDDSKPSEARQNDMPELDLFAEESLDALDD